MIERENVLENTWKSGLYRRGREAESKRVCEGGRGRPCSGHCFLIKSSLSLSRVARCAVSELALPSRSRVHHPPPGDGSGHLRSDKGYEAPFLVRPDRLPRQGLSERRDHEQHQPRHGLQRARRAFPALWAPRGSLAPKPGAVCVISSQGTLSQRRLGQTKSLVSEPQNT